MIDHEKIRDRLELLRHELSIGSAARRFKEADSLIAAFVASLGHEEVAIQFLLTREWQTLADEREQAARRIAKTLAGYGGSS